MTNMCHINSCPWQILLNSVTTTWASERPHDGVQSHHRYFRRTSEEIQDYARHQTTHIHDHFPNPYHKHNSPPNHITKPSYTTTWALELPHDEFNACYHCHVTSEHIITRNMTITICHITTSKARITKHILTYTSWPSRNLWIFQMKTMLRLVWSGFICVTLTQAATVSPQAKTLIKDDFSKLWILDMHCVRHAVHRCITNEIQAGKGRMKGSGEQRKGGKR